jgi:hypothetical protein
MNSKSDPFGVLGWACFAVLIYVLSVGPAARFGRDQLDAGRPNRIVSIVWLPVILLDRTPAQPIYRRYLRLWGVPAGAIPY